jgi:O-antigen/teichoic acid export membrane protein
MRLECADASAPALERRQPNVPKVRARGDIAGAGAAGTFGLSGQQAAMSANRRGFALSLLSQVLTLGIGLTNGMLTARVLGVEGRGQLAAIQNPASFVGYVLVFGVPSAVAYFTARARTEARAIFATSWALTFLLAIPILTVAWLVLPWVMKGDAAPLLPDGRFYLLYALPQLVNLLGLATLQGLGRFGVLAAFRLIPFTFSLLAMLVAYVSGRPEAPLVTRLVLLFSLVTAAATIWAVARSSRGPWSVERSRVPALVWYALPSALMVPVGSLNMQLDQLLMAALFPSRELGLYAISVSWSSLSSPAFAALGTVIFPNLAATENPEIRRRTVMKTFRLSLILGAVIVLGHVLATPIFIPLFFGRAFAPAVGAAMVLAAANICLSIAGLAGDILRGLGRPRGPLYAHIFALPVTGSLLYLLLPRLGILGAALASLVAYVVVLAINLVFIMGAAHLRLRDLVPRGSDVRELVSHLASLLQRLTSATRGSSPRTPN